MTANTEAHAPTVREQALAQRGAGVRHFTLAPDAEWVATGGGKVARTIGRNDVLMLTYTPEGGRIAEIPLYVILEAEAAGAF